MLEIDIIIPFRDAVGHLNNICSCLNLQTSNKFTVYFVSDHSTDGSIELIKSLDLNFKYKILESFGSGPGAARNTGIEESYNDYICFIDADDKISYDYIEKFLLVAMNEEPDIIECMFKAINTESEVVSKTNLAPYISCEDRFDSLISGVIPRLSWGKAFKREHLLKNNARFPNDIYNGEDHVFLLLAYNKNPRISLIFEFMYFWVRHPNSLTNRTPTEKNVFDFIAVSEIKYKIFTEKLNPQEIDEETLQKNKLTFSRRLFKEARSLKHEIIKNSVQHSLLIDALKMNLLASEILDEPINIIKNDNTSYWSDVIH